MVNQDDTIVQKYLRPEMAKLASKISEFNLDHRREQDTIYPADQLASVAMHQRFAIPPSIQAGR